MNTIYSEHIEQIELQKFIDHWFKHQPNHILLYIADDVLTLVTKKETKTKIGIVETRVLTKVPISATDLNKMFSLDYLDGANFMNLMYMFTKIKDSTLVASHCEEVGRTLIEKAGLHEESITILLRVKDKNFGYRHHSRFYAHAVFEHFIQKLSRDNVSVPEVAEY